MSLKSLNTGDTVAGLLVDGVEETPYTGATLKMESSTGVIVEIPYVDHPEANQFDHVAHWFKTRTPPMNLALLTPEGEIGLFGIRWTGHRFGAGLALGKLKPRETLLGEYDGNLDEPLLIDKARSRIDGLAEWTSLRSIDVLPESDDQGLLKQLTINAKPVDGGTWNQGEATMRFVSEWRTSLPNKTTRRGLNIDEDVVLVSQFPTPRTFREHLAEQRKVVHLLTLVSGLPIHFREHKVTSPGIVTRSLAGTVLDHPNSPLISGDTVQDYAHPAPASNDFNLLLASFDQLGIKGMKSWSEKYDRWSKFILPAVGLLGRNRPFAEDVVNTLSMCIEAAGHLIGKRAGEECTYAGKKLVTSTFVFRCLDVVGVHWGEIAPNYEGLARGIGKTYNATKHFNEGKYPDAEVLYLVSAVIRYIVRLLALHLADETGALLAAFKEEGALLRLKNLHKHYGVSFDAKGNVVLYQEGIV